MKRDHIRDLMALAYREARVLHAIGFTGGNCGRLRLCALAECSEKILNPTILRLEQKGYLTFTRYSRQYTLTELGWDVYHIFLQFESRRNARLESPGSLQAVKREEDQPGRSVVGDDAYSGTLTSSLP